MTSKSILVYSDSEVFGGQEIVTARINKRSRRAGTYAWDVLPPSSENLRSFFWGEVREVHFLRFRLADQKITGPLLHPTLLTSVTQNCNAYLKSP